MNKQMNSEQAIIEYKSFGKYKSSSNTTVKQSKNKHK